MINKEAQKLVTPYTRDPTINTRVSLLKILLVRGYLSGQGKEATIHLYRDDQGFRGTWSQASGSPQINTLVYRTVINAILK